MTKRISPQSTHRETFAKRHLSKSVLICPISASGSNFNPRNIPYIPVVEIFAFLELEQKLPFFKGLGDSMFLLIFSANSAVKKNVSVHGTLKLEIRNLAFLLLYC
jgi:delta-aminolevulinic acid dehydratase/porphobilinogen synthase